jgi:hypothetical protein
VWFEEELESLLWQHKDRFGNHVLQVYSAHTTYLCMGEVQFRRCVEDWSSAEGGGV